MHGIKLCFSSTGTVSADGPAGGPSSTPELFRLEFSHPLNSEKIVSVRGKSGGASGTGESFQWTPAVKALSILILRSLKAQLVRSGLENRSELPAGVLSKETIRHTALEGEVGTPASSLDNALGKEPVWLAEAFGRDQNGAPLCRRLFRRTNPDKRFPGPVAVSLNPGTWDALAVRVENNGIGVDQIQAVAGLLEPLENEWRTYDRSRSPNRSRTKPVVSSRKQAAGDSSAKAEEPPAAAAAEGSGDLQFQKLRSILFQCCLRELSEGVNRTDIFNRERLSKTIKTVVEDEAFMRAAGKSVSIASPIDLGLSSAGRLGICNESRRKLDQFFKRRPVTVACAPALFSAYSIFEHLRMRSGYQFQINFNFPHAVEIVRELLAGKFAELPDLLVLGTPPAATLFSRPLGAEYQPLMVLPFVTQKIVSPDNGAAKRRDELNFGRYLMMFQDPSHPMFMFEALNRRGFIRPGSVETQSFEPDETLSVLREGDPESRAILFFPHYDLNRIFNGCRYLPNPISSPEMQAVVLLVHRRISGDPDVLRALDIALRDSWLRLRESAAEREQTVRRILLNEDLIRAFARFGGLHNIADQLEAAAV